MRITFYVFSTLILFSSIAPAAIPPSAQTANVSSNELYRQKMESRKISNSVLNSNPSMIFDLPVTYNKQIAKWINYYQTTGKAWFGDWIERSTKYMPFITHELKNAGLPQDLGYMVMIESGFSANAISTASAVGPWQFIEATGTRYGLKVNWWLDERRDLKKSTLAAAKYIQDLYREFGSWYLVAASYNMGESGLRNRIKKYGTRDFWTLASIGALPDETTEYVPKILAAMIISKAPGLYGFRGLAKLDPLDYDLVKVPGGADLDKIADHLEITRKSLKDLNSELKLGYIPKSISEHTIRVPKGASNLVVEFINSQSQRVAYGY